MPTDILPAGVSTEPPSRRDFLYLTTATVAAVGAAATLYPLIDQMNPDAATIAAGGPVEVDVSALQPGQQIVAFWQQHPVFVVSRTPEAVAKLSDPALLARLSDPDSEAPQQPEYVRNATRSVKPEIGVYVGVCTHLGCIPLGSKPTDPRGNFGGWFCPCHGSQYDTSGRIRQGPAPANLPVEPYVFETDTKIKIG